jgi:hypothetical protein
MNIRIAFKPQDLWIGLYIERRRVYICLLPTLPICITWRNP